ncbi:MAG: TerC/Alx family metal homeostasis membrane protein [Alphaproteobacteria bacterium]|nr:TerC/Alx family metal homeostasis membrane protein [Alphaproteobacteria bacterium]
MEVFFPWAGSLLLILTFLALDLGVFNRTAHKISTREAFIASSAWISLSLLFNLFIWYWKGGEPALAFFTGYLIEKLLSLDNMFIFLVIFKFFGIAPRHQHRVLFWGVIGAIVFRLLMILIGIKLIESFEWILYLFGLLLLYSSYKMFRERNTVVNIENNTILLYAKKCLPLRENYKGRHFFLHRSGTWIVTPLFLTLLLIEVSDIVFAIDSIPAIFAVTLDPFIVFTSNIFAILGLRSLYFLLANLIPRFYYLQHALSGILGFVGIKLLLANHVKIPLGLSLGVITFVLICAILASLWREKYIYHLK